jgi:hypothetical protein
VKGKLSDIFWWRRSMLDSSDIHEKSYPLVWSSSMPSAA